MARLSMREHQTPKTKPPRCPLCRKCSAQLKSPDVWNLNLFGSVAVTGRFLFESKSEPHRCVLKTVIFVAINIARTALFGTTGILLKFFLL